MLVTKDYIEIKLLDAQENILVVQLENYKADITLQEIKDQLQPAMNKIDSAFRWRSPQGNNIVAVEEARIVHIESNITELE